MVTSDVRQAEDLVQEAFVKCAGRLGGIRDIVGFGKYWQQTVLRLAANEARRRSYERRLITRLAASRTLEQVVSTGDASDSRLMLDDALGTLTPRQRAVIVARFYLDLSEADTAEALGMRRGTVKSTTARGLAALRLAMSAEVNS